MRNIVQISEQRKGAEEQRRGEAEVPVSLYEGCWAAGRKVSRGKRHLAHVEMEAGMN